MLHPFHLCIASLSCVFDLIEIGTSYKLHMTSDWGPNLRSKGQGSRSLRTTVTARVVKTKAVLLTEEM